MSQNPSLTQVQLLIENLKKTWKSIADCNPYQDTSKMERVNDRIGSIRVVTNDITQKAFWDEQQELYKTLLPEFNRLKQQFSHALNNLLQVDNKVHKQQFERAVKNYYQGLKALKFCQLIMADSLSHPNRLQGEKFPERIKFLNEQYEFLKQEIESYKTNICLLGDKKIGNSLSKHNEISLKSIASLYEDAYTQSWGDWAWIKKYFRNSDRAQEIEFLNQLSKQVDCDELIQVQAAALVHNKILDSEFFGSRSQLGKLLGKFLKEKEHPEGEYDNLADFLERHKDIKNVMPESLKLYFKENQEKRSENTVSKFSF
ncbi:hypothetical protein OQJ13_13710 [Legionella sp. PATHC035]|uniref:hypothetical protein n=1 Tax=Legionella sp. PATHC035 TaxID=2992040 RepID=UPI0022446DFA|nr:hypothetical protein [Legionella sp. PATHC035]MCW8410032.1 hypothetical protein [Legionella sp. PATHC035]